MDNRPMTSHKKVDEVVSGLSAEHIKLDIAALGDNEFGVFESSSLPACLNTPDELASFSAMHVYGLYGRPVYCPSTRSEVWNIPLYHRGRLEIDTWLWKFVSAYHARNCGEPISDLPDTHRGLGAEPIG